MCARHSRAWFVGLVCLVPTGALAQDIHGREGITLPSPPPVTSTPVFDDYFGTKIPDNYRWLEDAKSPETRAYIDAQNAYTARYLKQARIRSQAVDDLTELEDVSDAGIPIERGGNYFFRKRLAGEQQASLYMRSGEGAAAHRSTTPGAAANQDVRLVDPAKLSRDPNTSVGMLDVSRDGKLLAYSLKEGGADEVGVHLLNIATKKDPGRRAPRGPLFRCQLSHPTAKASTTPAITSRELLFRHILGTRNSADTLIFGHEFRGEPLTGDDLFSGALHRRWPLSRHPDRPRRACPARRHRLP